MELRPADLAPLVTAIGVAVAAATLVINGLRELTLWQAPGWPLRVELRRRRVSYPRLVEKLGAFGVQEAQTALTKEIDHDTVIAASRHLLRRSNAG